MNLSLFKKIYIKLIHANSFQIQIQTHVPKLTFICHTKMETYNQYMCLNIEWKHFSSICGIEKKKRFCFCIANRGAKFTFN